MDRLNVIKLSGVLVTVIAAFGIVRFAIAELIAGVPVVFKQWIETVVPAITVLTIALADAAIAVPGAAQARLPGLIRIVVAGFVAIVDFAGLAGVAFRTVLVLLTHAQVVHVPMDAAVVALERKCAEGDAVRTVRALGIPV